MRTQRPILALLAAAALVSAVIGAEVLDRFTRSLLTVSWATIRTGLVNISLSGTTLTIESDGDGKATDYVTAYRIPTSSWKASVQVKQTAATTSLPADCEQTAFMTFGQPFPGASTPLVFTAYVTVTPDGTTVGWEERDAILDVVIDSDSTVLSGQKSFKGNISLSYSAQKDRLSITVGRTKWAIDDYIADLAAAGYAFGEPQLGIGGSSAYTGSAPAETLNTFTLNGFKSSGGLFTVLNPQWDKFPQGDTDMDICNNVLPYLTDGDGTTTCWITDYRVSRTNWKAEFDLKQSIPSVDLLADSVQEAFMTFGQQFANFDFPVVFKVYVRATPDGTTVGWEQTDTNFFPPQVIASDSTDLASGQSFRGKVKLDYDATLDRLTVTAGPAVWTIDDYIATLEDAGYNFGQPYLGIGGISTYDGDAPIDNIVPFTFDNFKATGLTLPYGG
jgi:hypothetical protein